MSASPASSKGRQTSKAQAGPGAGRSSGRSPAQATKAKARQQASQAAARKPAQASAQARGGTAGGGTARGGTARGATANSAPAKGAGAKGAPAKGGAARGAQTALPLTGWRRFLPSPQTMGWLPFTTFVLCVLGLADAGYQVYTHFTGTGLLGCAKSTDSCVLVQSSTYAWIFGIPVAVYGAAFFVFMVAICSPWGWRLRQPLVRYARLAAVIIGMVFVLYLVYREVVTLGQICEYCTSVHIITFLLFGLIVYDASAPKPVAPVRSGR